MKNNDQLPFELTYVTKQGWMLTVLGLKDKELDAFALVWGFSQDGESELKGGYSFICKWLTCTRPTARKAMDGLEAKNYIIKRVEEINNVEFNRYRVNFAVVWPMVRDFLAGKDILLPPGKVNLHPPGKEDLHSTYSKGRNVLDTDTPGFLVPSLEEVTGVFLEKLKAKGDKVKTPEHWAAWEAEKFIEYWTNKKWKAKRQYINWKRRVVGWIRSGMERSLYTRICPSHPDYGKKPWELEQGTQQVAPQTLFSTDQDDPAQTASEMGDALANVFTDRS